MLIIGVVIEVRDGRLHAHATTGPAINQSLGAAGLVSHRSSVLTDRARNSVLVDAGEMLSLLDEDIWNMIIRVCEDSWGADPELELEIGIPLF